MKVLVLGATGPCGVLTCQYALQAGHKLVVYVRNPDKLPKGKYSIHISAHDDVQVIGGQLTDLSALRSALSECNAVISSLGPAVTRDKTTQPITDGYKLVLEAMREEGVKRLIVLSTTSVHNPFDAPTWTSWLIELLINAIGPGAYQDVLAYGDLISRADDIDWTIVRVPFLASKPGNSYTTGYIGDGKVGWFLRREAFAQFMIDELAKGDWIKRMPVISNA